MKTMRSRVFVLTLTIILAGVAGRAPAQDWGLLDAVPNDVFVAQRTTHTDEGAFIEENWARVWTAVKDSGALQDVYNLVTSQLPPTERSHVQEQWNLAWDRLNQVDWEALTSQEAVLAIRLILPEGVIQNPEPYLPSVLAMFRVEEEKAAEIFEGLIGIQTHIAAFSPNVTVVPGEYGDAKVSSISVMGMIELPIAHRGDVIMIAFKPGLMQDAIDLLSGSAEVAPLTGDQRFTELFARLPEPEMSACYVDGRRVTDMVEQVMDQIATQLPADDPDASNVLRILEKLKPEIRLIDRYAATKRVEGLQTIEESLCVLMPGFSDTIIGRVTGGQEGFDDFHRYLPTDTVNFQLFEGLDPALLYDEIIAFVLDIAPEAQEGIEEFQEEFQEETGYDLRNDILEPISGEMIAVALPGMAGMPQPAYLVRMDDRDRALDLLAEALNGIKTLAEESGQTINIGPARGELGDAEFVLVSHPMMMMMQTPGIVIGTLGDYMVLAFSDAIGLKLLKTYQGDAQSFAETARFKEEIMLPEGKLTALTYRDLSNEGAMIGQQLSMLPMMGMMIPPEPETEPLRKIFSVVGKLGQAAFELNFRKSMASATTMDHDEGMARTITVMTYKESAKETAKSGGI